MELEALSVGMIVKSKAGHDSGSWCVVIRIEDGYAYIADGKHRKLSALKKKNPLHLSKTRTVLDLTDITDKKLRTALRDFDLKSGEESDHLV